MRVVMLEEFKHACDVREAAAAERDKAAIEWMESIDKHLSDWSDNFKWLAKLIIGALMLSVIAFVVAGGLKIT